jgi:excisionase family DNA binding protein
MSHVDSKLKTIREAAAMLNVSISALYRKIQTEEIPAYRFGRKVLVDFGEVLASMRRDAQDQDAEL